MRAFSASRASKAFMVERCAGKNTPNVRKPTISNPPSSTKSRIDPYAAFEVALEKLEKRVRRYKRRLRDHHQREKSPLPAEQALSFVVAASEEEEAESDVGYEAVEAPAVIAETETHIKTMTASMAVMQLELMEIPALMFRNAKHGGLNMVYRRADGHIGWVDPGKAN